MVDTKAVDKLCREAGRLAGMATEGIQKTFLVEVIGLKGKFGEEDYKACPSRQKMVEALCLEKATRLGL